MKKSVAKWIALLLSVVMIVMCAAGCGKAQTQEPASDNTAAAVSLQNGADMKTASSTPGHFGAGFTLRACTHVARRMQERWAMHPPRGAASGRGRSMQSRPSGGEMHKSERQNSAQIEIVLHGYFQKSRYNTNKNAALHSPAENGGV